MLPSFHMHAPCAGAIAAAGVGRKLKWGGIFGGGSAAAASSAAAADRGGFFGGGAATASGAHLPFCMGTCCCDGTPRKPGALRMMNVLHYVQWSLPRTRQGPALPCRDAQATSLYSVMKGPAESAWWCIACCQPWPVLGCAPQPLVWGKLWLYLSGTSWRTA